MHLSVCLLDSVIAESKCKFDVGAPKRSFKSFLCKILTFALSFDIFACYKWSYFSRYCFKDTTSAANNTFNHTKKLSIFGTEILLKIKLRGCGRSLCQITIIALCKRKAMVYRTHYSL